MMAGLRPYRLISITATWKTSAKKFAVANRLGPVAAAIFANSPFVEGSFRVINRRAMPCGLKPTQTARGRRRSRSKMTFPLSDSLIYLRSVPMLFIRRGGEYINMAGRSFAQFVANGAGDAAIFQDFTDHLSTIFTEARLKPAHRTAQHGLRKPGDGRWPRSLSGKA